MQQKIIDAMVESGASAEDVAKSVVQLKLLEAIGEAPEKMAKGPFTYDVCHPGLLPLHMQPHSLRLFLNYVLHIFSYITGSTETSNMNILQRSCSAPYGMGTRYRGRSWRPFSPGAASMQRPRSGRRSCKRSVTQNSLLMILSCHLSYKILILTKILKGCDLYNKFYY